MLLMFVKLAYIYYNNNDDNDSADNNVNDNNIMVVTRTKTMMPRMITTMITNL